MKKLFKSLFVVIAATATFAGCQKEENNAPAAQTKTVEFFANSIETKTVFGESYTEGTDTKYPTLWSAGDEVKILVNLASVKNTEKTAEVECSSDFTSARFESPLVDPGTETYTFYSISPANALLGKAESGKLYVSIPDEQKPLDTSVDKAAQLLYAKSTTTDVMPESVNLHYSHLTAYGKFALSNLTSEVSSVSKVTIQAPEDVYLAGSWDYFVNDDSFVVRSGKGVNAIDVETTKTSDIWFACAPVDVAGKTVKFIVATDKGNLEKDITFPTGCKFESGKIATFTVNMAGIEPPVQEETGVTLTKVESVSDFTPGTYIIVSSDDKYYVPNAVYTTGDGPALKSVEMINSEIQVSDDMLWNVKVSGSGMLFESASASGNYLVATGNSTKAIKVNDTSNCVWSAVLLNDNVGIMSSASTTRYLCSFGTTDWRYYASSNITGTNKLAVLYKVSGLSGGDEPDPAEPVQLTMTDITCSAQTENSLTFTWTPVTNASKYEVTINGITAEVSEATYTATGLTAATSYTISVKAVGDGVNYTTSAAKTQTGTTSAASTGGEGGKEVTITFKLDKTTTGSSSSSYVNVATTFMSEGVSYTVANWNPSTLQIRGNKSPSNNDLQQAEGDRNFMLRNTTAIPGTIKSIRIEYTAGTIVAGKTYAIVGASQITSQTANASQTAIAETNAVSWTFANGGSYFAIGMVNGGTSGTTKAGTITIVYQAN